MRKNVSAIIADLDTSLANKIREIIEGQWGKRLADIKDLNIEQLYERRVREGRISYRPTNRFILQAKFLTAREPKRLTFNLAA